MCCSQQESWDCAVICATNACTLSQKPLCRLMIQGCASPLRTVIHAWLLQIVAAHCQFLQSGLSCSHVRHHVSWATRKKNSRIEDLLLQTMPAVGGHCNTKCQHALKQKKRKGRLFLGHLACKVFSTQQLSALRERTISSLRILPVC